MSYRYGEKKSLGDFLATRGQVVDRLASKGGSLVETQRDLDREGTVEYLQYLKYLPELKSREKLDGIIDVLIGIIEHRI